MPVLATAIEEGLEQSVQRMVDRKTKDRTSQLTIRWPAGSKVPVIHGRWTRLVTGEIQADYTLPELELVLWFTREVVQCEKPARGAGKSKQGTLTFPQN